MRLNDELLKRLVARWECVAPLAGDWMSLPAVDSLRAEAADIIAAEFGDARLAVVKDPRLCRGLPFWRDLFIEAGFSPFAVLAPRGTGASRA